MKIYKIETAFILRSEQWFDRSAEDAKAREEVVDLGWSDNSLRELIKRLRERFDVELVDVELERNDKGQVSSLAYSEMRTHEGKLPTDEEWVAYESGDCSLIAVTHFFEINVVIERGLKGKEMIKAGLHFA